MREILVRLLLDFLNGKNSVEDAKAIESFIVQNFPADGILEELADDLAAYSPGGGQGLYDYERLLPKIRFALNHLKK